MIRFAGRALLGVGAAFGVRRLRREVPLGANYDTEWARKPAARFGRMVAVEGFSRPVINLIATPTIKGLDRLDDVDMPVIFAANHNSHLDTSLLLTAVPFRFRQRSVVAAGADYFFNRRWKAALWAFWINVIPIEREKVGRRSADLAARLIGEGWNLIIFPEGTRSRDGYMGPFRGGAAYLGIKCDVAIVPVFLEGTGKILGAHARWLKPGRTKVTFGAPLVAAPGEKARDFNRRIEAAVAAAADEGRTDRESAEARAERGTTPSVAAPVDVTDAGAAARKLEP